MVQLFWRELCHDCLMMGSWCWPMLRMESIYLDLDLIFLLFRFNLRILFFLHFALILLDSGINTWESIMWVQYNAFVTSRIHHRVHNLINLFSLGLLLLSFLSLLASPSLLLNNDTTLGLVFWAVVLGDPGVDELGPVGGHLLYQSFGLQLIQSPPG